MPITYVCTPAARSAETAWAVASPSRQPRTLPLMPVQQFMVPPGMHILAWSMLLVHWSTEHCVIVGQQFGPPSVARITNVKPGKSRSLGTSDRNVAAVGVPPAGVIAVAAINAVSVFPRESPRRSDMTSTPAAQSLVPGAGNTVTPNLAFAPIWFTRLATAARTFTHLSFSSMLPDTSSTKYKFGTLGWRGTSVPTHDAPSGFCVSSAVWSAGSQLRAPHADIHGVPASASAATTRDTPAMPGHPFAADLSSMPIMRSNRRAGAPEAGRLNPRPTLPSPRPPRRVGRPLAGLRNENLQRCDRRRTLREALARSLAAGERAIRHRHFDLEDLLVRGSAQIDDAIDRRGPATSLHPFLERALWIEHPQRLGLAQQIPDHLADQRPRPGQPTCFVDRRDEGLGGVGQHVRLLAFTAQLGAPSKRDARAEVDAPRPRRKRRSVDQRAAHARQLSFIGVGVRRGEHFTDAEAQDRISQKFEALVVWDAGLVGEARVGQRLLEARDRPRADDRLDVRSQPVWCRGEQLGVAHPQSLSVASAAARSSSVTPPASCVDHATRARPQPSSTSG